MKRNKMKARIGLKITEWLSELENSTPNITKIDALSERILNECENSGMKPPTYEVEYDGYDDMFDEKVKLRYKRDGWESEDD